MFFNTLLEILKLSIPALVVFFTVDRLLGRYLNHHAQVLAR